jgi:hypothetical protein
MRVRGGQVAWLTGAVAAVLVMLAWLRLRGEQAAEATPDLDPSPALSAVAGQPADAAPAAAAQRTAHAGPDAGLPGSSEADLMRAATAALEHAPDRTLALIAAADRAYGARSEPRRALEIEAQVRLGRIGHARSLADRFYRAFPDSPASVRIERLTGYHPRPYGPR